jgi:dipeptidyl aminopeptidase/acylaminoacyl peptidase
VDVHRFRARGLACLLALLAPTPTLAQQGAEAQATVPVADFFRIPRVARPALSANGKYLAAAVADDGGRVQLAVFDLENNGQARIVAGFRDADVSRIWWVNDQRIVFDAIDREPSVSRPLAPGLWGVNRDGSGFRQLISASGDYSGAGRSSIITDRKLSWDWQFHDVLADGSNDVLVQGLITNSVREVVDSKVARLDTVTGVTRSLSDGAPDHVLTWVMDRQGQPAAVTTLHDGRYQSYLRSSSGAGWEKWQDAAMIGGSYATPFWVGFDGQLVALDRRVDDASALYDVDTKTHQLKAEPAFRLKGYDFSGDMVVDANARRLVGVHYETDAQGTVWLEPLMQATQSAIDVLLPTTVNRIDCQRCMSVPTILVTATSDRQPPIYFLYNRDTKVLRQIAASRPWIKPQSMGMREVQRFTARDGLSIPVLVTHPPGSANVVRPAVVLVHGGPWVRGTHWRWEPEAQFLATRGYVVIEPEFRGSQGYGFKLFRAGWKQWGMRMQDDVADATNWAVQQGWVDPKRVCIAGASYGGYATLMGLVRYNDLYQCGVEWAGVTDINLMYSITWSDSSKENKGYSMPVLVGDRVTDAQQLKDTSPLELAASVRRPLLMAYGGADERVPIEHGKAFRDAVARTNKDVEWVTYPDEGHGWLKFETQVDFWTRVEKFLDRNLRAEGK